MNFSKLKQVSEIANSLMKHFGISSKYKFVFGRAKRFCGYCIHPWNGKPGLIKISQFYADANPIELVEETIRHEIAHALAGPGCGHGPIWKAKCLIVGCRPLRCNELAEMPKGKYVANCQGCMQEFRWHRRPKYINSLSCSKCGTGKGKLFVFEEKPNEMSTV